MKTLSNNNIQKIPLLLIILVSMMIACSPSDDDEPRTGIEDPLQPQPVVTTSVSGVVVDETGKPLASVAISVFGETSTTDDQGGFYLPEIEVPGNRCVVQATKMGYFPATRAQKPIKNGHTEVRLIMMEQPVTHTFQSSAGVEAELDNGSAVSIEPGSLVTASGDSYDGPVSLSLRHLDPSAGNFGILVPGGDMVARRDDESTSILYSYGVLRVVMTDANGELLQLADGKTSTITMDIPDEQLNTAPVTIPLWYFDEEAGIWVEDGSASRNGDKYVGSVSHFTDWNCDSDTEGATIIGRLIDCDGNPGWGQVEFGQIASDPQSYTETNQSDGSFSRRVPDGVSITVVISDPLIVSPLTKNERGKVIVIVPPLAPGQVYDVGDIQTYPCHISVKGTFKTKEGDRVNGVYFGTNSGVKSLFELGEELNTTLPPDADITMTIYTEGGVSLQTEFRTPSEGNELDLGIIDITGNVIIDQEVKITGSTFCFGEPEIAGQISVSWQDESGTNFNYTTPRPDGAFEIAVPLGKTVTVKSSTEHGNWEKTVATGEVVGAVIGLEAMEICENELVGETSMIINGDGFANETISIVQNINVQALNAGLFYVGTNMTAVYETDMYDDKKSLTIQFPGQSLGEREFTGEIALSLRLTRNGVETLYWAYPELPGTSLVLKVTRYDEVGGVIEGTFSGTFAGLRNSAFTNEMVAITEGKFSVLRYADVQ